MRVRPEDGVLLVGLIVLGLALWAWAGGSWLVDRLLDLLSADNRVRMEHGLWVAGGALVALGAVIEVSSALAEVRT
jgi:hypothetical protein